MPKIEISQKDLCSLIGRKLSAEQLKELMLYAKGEVDEVSGDAMKVDIKDTNRLDLWSTEGIAREIKGRLNEKGLPVFKLKAGKVSVIVDTKSPIQPLAVCAIARNLKIDDNFLSQIIQLQEKLAVTFGKNRKEISMGVYDLDKIKFPVKYTSMHRDKIRFAPLGHSKEMGAREILEHHQKGKEFGHLMHGEEYPVWMDGNNKILSMPPIINSNDIGNVTAKTKNVFIECTGYDMKFLQTCIDTLAAQMLDRKGDVETVTTITNGKKITTPSLQPKKFYTSVTYINKVSGLNLPDKKIIDLLEMARYKCKIAGRKASVGGGKRIELEYPGYRQDIMHERDVAEDAIISYGYNNIKPEPPKLITKGGISAEQIKSNRVAEIMAGAGFQEILSYTLTNSDNIHEKMNTNGTAIEIENPVSTNWSVFRTWLLPGLLEFLSKNQHIEYPHMIFETGQCIVLANTETRSKDIPKLAAAVSASTVNYETISSSLDALFRNLGIKYSLKKCSHPSFIEGRCAEIIVGKEMAGYVGEIHPLVLNNWSLEKPVVAFEIGLEEIFKMLK